MNNKTENNKQDKNFMFESTDLAVIIKDLILTKINIKLYYLKGI